MLIKDEKRVGVRQGEREELQKRAEPVCEELGCWDEGVVFDQRRLMFVCGRHQQRQEVVEGVEK